jgi:hypothetical protein
VTAARAHPLDGRCLGCWAPLGAGREVRYCSKRCRSVVRTIERAEELQAAARAAAAELGWTAEVEAMQAAADEKFLAAWQAGEAIRADVGAGG